MDWLKRITKERKEKFKIIPKLIIIDGVDGVGKTSVVEKIIKEFEKEQEKVIWNKFKRRRSDKEEFEVPSKEYEWKFRREVVAEINKRLVT